MLITIFNNTQTMNHERTKRIIAICFMTLSLIQVEDCERL